MRIAVAQQDARRLKQKRRFIHRPVIVDDRFPFAVLGKQIQKALLDRLEVESLAGATLVALVEFEVDLGRQVVRFELQGALEPHARLFPAPEPLHPHTPIVQGFGIRVAKEGRGRVLLCRQLEAGSQLAGGLRRGARFPVGLAGERLQGAAPEFLPVLFIGGSGPAIERLAERIARPRGPGNEPLRWAGPRTARSNG